jgi:hypothetical protein
MLVFSKPIKHTFPQAGARRVHAAAEVSLDFGIRLIKPSNSINLPMASFGRFNAPLRSNHRCEP